MSSNWREVKLGDVVDEITVGHVGTMARHYRETGIPFLRSLNVLPHRLDLSDVKFIDPEFERRLAKSRLRPGDVVIVRTGKPGATAVIPESLPDANCSDLVIVRPGTAVDARWLSYYMNAAATSFVAAHLVGAVQQHFNVGSARELRLSLPAISEQRAITEVLGALDDKIAANSALIGTAEELAVALAALVTGRTAVGQVAQPTRSSVNPQTMVEAAVDHYSLPAFDAGRSPERVLPEEIKSSKFRLMKPAVLVSKLNPRFPRVWDVLTLPDVPALASTEFVVLEPKDISTTALWALLSQPSVSAAIQGMVAGTSGSHQRVKPDAILSTEIGDPATLGQSALDQITALGRRAANARIESAALAATRDDLLPGLMSGKLRVKDAERLAESLA